MHGEPQRSRQGTTLEACSLSRTMSSLIQRTTKRGVVPPAAAPAAPAATPPVAVDGGRVFVSWATLHKLWPCVLPVLGTLGGTGILGYFAGRKAARERSEAGGVGAFVISQQRPR